VEPTFRSVCPLLLKVQQEKGELAGTTSLKPVLALRVLEQKPKYKEVVLISRSIRHRGPAPIPDEVKLSLIVKLIVCRGAGSVHGERIISALYEKR